MTGEGRSGRWFAGVLLIALGAAFLFHLPIGRLIALGWPVVLIVIGLSHLTSNDRRPNSGLLLILLGGLFLAINLGFFAWWAIGRLWPLALIALGVWLLVRRRSSDEPFVDSGGSVTARVVFGGARRVVAASGWTGGTVSVVFGGLELDLRGATLAAEGAVVSVDVVFGGVTMIVPPEWDVRLEGSPVFGGVSDSRLRPPAPAGGDAVRPRLTVKATALFGGVEVKS